MSRLHRFGSILLMALVMAPRVGRAESAVVHQAAPGAAAERQKLRNELDRVNAEIDALKRDRRGLRDDYRLRERMADAEALARRLTELDARLGADGRAVPRTGDAAWPSAPEARPSDDRADLEAKADILVDQSRNLNRQADVLAGRLLTLRGRQELWRRAGQLERDPFSPLEQPKRRVVAGVTAAADFRTKATPTGGGPPATFSPTPASGPGTSAPGAGASGAGAADMAPRGGTTTSGAPPTAISAPAGPSSATLAGSTNAPSAIPVGPAPAVESAGSIASQFRGILDATTLAEIRRLEVLGSSTGNLQAGTQQAMERALTALRARAQQLATNAGELRTRARAAR